MKQNNCQKLKGLLSAVSLAVAACPVFAVQYDVAAYVWPAYQPEPRWAELGIFGAGKGEWQSVWEAVPKWEGHDQPRKPLWGYENEADPKVMEKKIEAAVSHGVNVFIYDWYWYGGRPFLEDALDKGFLGAKNNDKMKFFLMWANHNVIKLWDNTVADKAVTLSIPVANVGKTDGTEVVQVYVRNPQDPTGPIMQLRGYERVSVKAGATATAKIELTQRSFEWFDEGSNTMRVKPGKYELLYGNSSDATALQSIAIEVK